MEDLSETAMPRMSRVMLGREESSEVTWYLSIMLQSSFRSRAKISHPRKIGETCVVDSETYVLVHERTGIYEVARSSDH